MSSQRVVILKGSPKEHGNSAILAEQVAAGALAAGAEIKSFYLHGMEIKPCDACATCRAEGYPGCHIQDDMQEIYAAIEAADALVIASPTYFHFVSAQTKLVIDRCFAMADEDGWTLRGKKIGVVMTFGNVDPFRSGAVNAFRAFQGVSGHIGAEGVGFVYGSGGAQGAIRENDKVMREAFSLGEKLAA